MRKIYSSFYHIGVVLVIAIGLSSCSENEEDIAAPSVIIISPVANDTIDLTNNFVTIKAEGQDKVHLKEMELVVTNESMVKLFTDIEDDIADERFICNEKFYPTGITKVTQLTLSVKFTNNLNAWGKKSIVFYVKP